MTKEEILAMEAGVDLDNLVCGEIFEWKTFGSVKHYSTDISAAWPVAVKMGLALFPLNNKDWCCCKAGYIYHVELGHDHHSDPDIVICKEAPEAICKAALLTKLDR